MLSLEKTVPLTQSFNDAVPAGDEITAAVRQIVAAQLAPILTQVDREGLYPEAVMRTVGAAGAFSQHLSLQQPLDLFHAIELMGVISEECLSTGFVTWCQDTCAWYLENSENTSLREKFLPAVSRGEILGGTGLSNPVKHLSGIEPARLQAERIQGGYIVNGILPWVSNLGNDHVFGTIFFENGTRPVMGLVPCNSDGFELKRNAEFTALEGTRTFACQFTNVFVPDEHVLAEDVAPYLQQIKDGFIMLQMGMALGISQGCINIISDTQQTLGHVNHYLDVQAEDLQEEVNDLTEATRVLCRDPFEQSYEYHRDVLQLRLAGSELSLKAANAAMLHCGARGYLVDAPAQRRLREAYFVAIITPATKHIKKELETLRNLYGIYHESH